MLTIDNHTSWYIFKVIVCLKIVQLNTPGEIEWAHILSLGLSGTASSPTWQYNDSFKIFTYANTWRNIRQQPFLMLFILAIIDILAIRSNHFSVWIFFLFILLFLYFHENISMYIKGVTGGSTSQKYIRQKIFQLCWVLYPCWGKLFIVSI